MPPIANRMMVLWLGLSAAHLAAAHGAMGADGAAGADGAKQPPNILWITSEDNGPQLGAYGDRYADTPHLDQFAARSLLYRTCWSNAPVCAPARTTIISGMYPTSTGGEHMRSMARLPDWMAMYPAVLREAGYWCTNNSKEDYNLQQPRDLWHQSSAQAHWRNRPDDGMPFFSVFNFTVSHESQVRKRPHRPVHDPAEAPVPAYHPDTPEVRRDWAQYYDKMTEMDAQVGQVLAELQADGLAESTIVFYYGDHGAGMPRSKRWPYNSGLHVPLIVHVPEAYRPLAPDDYQRGGTSERLVAFVDLMPTVLSLAGIEPPDYLQGRAFMGKYVAPPNEYLFGFRGRMDERYDLVRSVTDGRYVYLRHFMPHEIYGQHISYMFQTPTTQVWERMFREGKLNEAQSRFWQPKEVHELYDLRSDPDEVHDLADDPAHAATRERLGTALRQWMLQVRDVGLLPEGEMQRRSEGTTIYAMGHDPEQYRIERVLNVAEIASDVRTRPIERLRRAAMDSDAAVRYWAVLGLTIRGPEVARESESVLQRSLRDDSPDVRVAAAEGLARYGDAQLQKQALEVLAELSDVRHHSEFTAMAALNAIDALGEQAASILPDVVQLPDKSGDERPRTQEYVPRLLETLRTSPHLPAAD